MAEGFKYHCFNCKFRVSFTTGDAFFNKTRQFLSALGFADHEIDMMAAESIRQKSLVSLVETVASTAPRLRKFTPYTGSIPGDLVVPGSKVHEYLLSRHLVPDSYPYFEHYGKRDSVVIPFSYDGAIVGYAQRYLDNENPRFYMETQPGYVFGVDLQRPEWRYAIVTEGLTDALSVNGLALMHNEISPLQAQLLNKLQKQIIVVPDQDKSGLNLIDQALDCKYSVSIPPWPYDVKDVNDAVCRYGLIGTILTIVQHAEHHHLRVEMAKKQLERKIRANRLQLRDTTSIS